VTGGDPAPADEPGPRFTAVVGLSHDAIIEHTPDGVVTSWNAAAERMFGWTAAEAIGRRSTLIVPAERHAEDEGLLARTRDGGVIRDLQTIGVTRDGRVLYVSVTASPLRDATGRVTGGLRIVQDVTARRQDDIVSARLAAIIDSSDDAIVSKDLRGVIMSWNRAAERIFGWTAVEVIGRHITLIIPEDRRPEEDDVLSRIARGERVDHFETVRVTKDGRYLDISLTVSPIRDAAGCVVGASKIARDITDRRRMEQERDRLLTREQQARAEAEALNRTKDEFLATVSHELRTPLNAIFGWARILESGAVDDATRDRAIGAIVRSASAQSRLVEDLIDLSRVVTGRMRLDFEKLDLKTVIEAALEAVRPAANAKGITLTAALDGRIGTIVGAADRLQQVVWNLVMNAVKFTPRGGRIDVSLGRVDGSAEITVADTGEGIRAELLPHVFERFRQGDSSSTRAHAGLGLGLALVRHLVELHGGRVRAESPGEGRGSTFTVELPLTLWSARDGLGRDPAETSDAHAMLRGLRVLVVDDDEEALEVTVVALRNAGADVRTAGSAFRAYDAVDSWDPHILVSDLAMPGEDGFMLLRAMRSTFTRRGLDLAAIAVTAYGTPEYEARARQAGFDLYLTKPVDPARLATAIASLTRRAS
jgi:PAS domain S-box-containing protein